MNIVVTGASRGIGFELTKHIAAQGNHNIIVISRDYEKLRELKNACIRENIEAHVYPLQYDLSVDADFKSKLLPEIKSHFHSIDILINNAGLLVNKPLTELADTDFWQMIKVNFALPAQLISTLIPHIKKGGHIVNISSMGGYQGSAKFAGLSVYSATKAALSCLTECLAEEYKESGIAFNCLALGAVSTQMLADAFPGYLAPISAQTMASFIADFALNGNKYFNGKVIPVSLTTP